MNRDDHFKQLQKIATDLVEKDGDASSIFFLFDEKTKTFGIIPVSHLMGSEHGKDLLKAGLKKIMEEMDVDCYYHVTSAWMVKRNKGQRLDGAPSEQPDKASVLIVSEMHKTEGTRLVMKEYDGPAGNIKWLSEKQIDYQEAQVMASRFNIWHEVQFNIRDDEE